MVGVNARSPVLKRVAFVCAMPLEFIPLKRKLSLEKTVIGSLKVYAGSLDDTSQFKPQIAIFTRSRPAWDTSSQELTCFETVPLN